MTDEVSDRLAAALNIVQYARRNGMFMSWLGRDMRLVDEWELDRLQLILEGKKPPTITSEIRPGDSQ